MLEMNSEPVTPAERLRLAEAEAEKTTDALAAARQALEDLQGTIAKEHAAYVDAGATAFQAGAERPSRDRLTSLERELPDAKDLVDWLVVALAKAARRAREAKADVLDADAVAIGEETARRQAEIHELEPQSFTILREIGEHSRWIQNEGPLKAQQLRAEAQRLRSERP